MDPRCAVAQDATRLRQEEATVHHVCEAFQLLKYAVPPLGHLAYIVASLQYPVLAGAVLLRGAKGEKVFGHPSDHSLQDI